jgi:tetratricopeptide (TPR) repeat protein
MNHFACILFFLYSTCAFSQSRFEVSDSLFNKYAVSDSLKAKQQLEFQRTHIQTTQHKQTYLLNKAWYSFYRSRFDDAKEQLNAALQLKDNSTLTADFVKLESLIANKQFRYDESNRIIDNFLTNNTSVSKSFRAEMNITSCANYLSLGKYEKAKQKALGSYRILKNKQVKLTDAIKIRIFSSLYNVYYYEAKYDSALYYIYRSEPLLKDGTVEKANFYSSIAIVYTVNRKHRDAIRNYKKSIAILETLNNPVHLSHAYYNLAVSYKEANLDSSIVYYNKAISTAKAISNDQITGFSLQDLGDIYLTRKDYKRAREFNEEALSVFQQMNSERGVLHTKLNLGKLNLDTKQYDESVKVLQEALVIAENSEDITDLLYCYEYLYKTYEGKGDYRLAYRYYKLFSKTQQKIMRLELQSNIDHLNLTYQVKSKDSRNRLLKKQVEFKNKKITAEQITKWVAVCLLIVSVFAIVFLRRIFIQRAKLNELKLSLTQSELQLLANEKEQTLNELELLKQQLIAKNTLIGELNNLVIENEQNLISKEQLSRLTTNDQDWVQFLAKLQILFPSFAYTLKSRHPNLSNNEFRLAVLIKLNLSDKEISELLFIEISSVKKAKNRLKQKLQLDASEKLDAYIGLL